MALRLSAIPEITIDDVETKLRKLIPDVSTVAIKIAIMLKVKKQTFNKTIFIPITRNEPKSKLNNTIKSYGF